MGRRKTPTKTLEKRGSWRAGLNPQEPKPDPSRPTCPAWLPPAAKAAWRELCPQLHAMGVLTRVDRHLLAVYCVTWAHWRECVEFIDRHGLAQPIYSESKKKDKPRELGTVKRFPHSQMILALAEKLSKLGDSLGLSPAARSKMTARVPYREGEEPGPHIAGGEQKKTAKKKAATGSKGKGRFFGTA